MVKHQKMKWEYPTYFLQVFSEAGGMPTTSMVPCSMSSGAPNTNGNCDAFLLLL